VSTQTAPDAGPVETQAHIAANTRLQEIAATAAAAAWLGLGSYDEEDVPRFLARVVPVILAAQRQSVALTVAFLASAIGRRPAPVQVEQLVGAAIRTATPEVIAASQRGGLALAPDATGVPPQIVYRRPFVGVWNALGEGTPWADAVDAGRERVAGTAAFDVQNAMRHTLRAVGEADDLILGYRRVPDSDACPLCVLAAGRRYRTGVLMEIHTRCKCGIEVVTAANRGDFFGKAENDLAITPGDEVIRIVKHGATPNEPGLAVVRHGELGALLVADGDHFTDELDIAA
jgi:hypothetical protein